MNYELLKPGETVNTKHYKQQLIDLNRFPLKKDRNTKRDNTKLYSVAYDKTRSRHVGHTQLGSFTPCTLLTRLGSFQ